MAERPAQKEKSNELSLHGVDQVSPEYLHKKRLIEENDKRKRENVVVDEWLEVPHDVHPKGGKAKLCKRMKNGNVHRQYIGREKTVREILAKLVKKGLEIRAPKRLFS